MTHCRSRLSTLATRLREEQRQRDQCPADSPEWHDHHERVTALRYDTMLASADFDATRTQRDALSQSLAELDDVDAADSARKRLLAQRLYVGQALAEERERQAALMPDTPVDTDRVGRQLHAEIGQARDGMACARVQLGMANADSEAMQHWRAEHEASADKALRQQAQLSAHLNRGEPDMDQLSPAQRQRYNEASSDERTRTTMMSHMRATLDESPGEFDTPGGQQHTWQRPQAWPSPTEDASAAEATPTTTENRTPGSRTRRSSESRQGQNRPRGAERAPRMGGRSRGRSRRSGQRLMSPQMQRAMTQIKQAAPSGSGGRSSMQDGDADPRAALDPTGGLLFLLDIVDAAKGGK